MTEEEFSTRVKKYIEEIADLKSALKYVEANYYAQLVQILKEGHCPICGKKTTE